MTTDHPSPGRSAPDVAAILEQWLADVTPDRAPARLLEESFARTSSARQLRAWPWQRWRSGDWIGAPTLRSGSALTVLAVTALLLALLGLVVPLIGGPRQPAPTSSPSASLSAAVPIEPTGAVAVSRPFAIATDGSALWVLAEQGRVSRIDPSAVTVTATADLTPAGHAYQSIAAGAAAVWVTDRDAGTVIRLDPTTLAIVSTIAVGSAPKGILATASGIWVALTAGGAVVRIDPATNTVVATTPVGQAGPSGPNWLADGFGSIWVGVPNTQSVYRIDDATGSIVATIAIPPAVVPCGGLAVGLVEVWVTSCDNETSLARIDAGTNVVVATVPIQGFAYSALVVEGRPWLSVTPGAGGAATVERIDPATNRVDAVLSLGPTYTVGGDMADAGGSTWLLDAARNQVVRIVLPVPSL